MQLILFAVLLSSVLASVASIPSPTLLSQPLLIDSGLYDTVLSHYGSCTPPKDELDFVISLPSDSELTFSFEFSLPPEYEPYADSFYPDIFVGADMMLSSPSHLQCATPLLEREAGEGDGWNGPHFSSDVAWVSGKRALTLTVDLAARNLLPEIGEGLSLSVAAQVSSSPIRAFNEPLVIHGMILNAFGSVPTGPTADFVLEPAPQSTDGVPLQDQFSSLFAGNGLSADVSAVFSYALCGLCLLCTLATVCITFTRMGRARADVRAQLRARGADPADYRIKFVLPWSKNKRNMIADAPVVSSLGSRNSVLSAALPPTQENLAGDITELAIAE